MSEKTFRIGYAYLAKKSTVRNSRFPQPCWYEDVLVQPGRYTIYATEVYEPTMEVVYHSSFIQLTGSVDEDFFPKTVFGLPIGSYNREKNRGAQSSSTIGVRTYELAEAVLENDGLLEYGNLKFTIRLLPEFTPVCMTYTESGVITQRYSVIQTGQQV